MIGGRIGDREPAVRHPRPRRVRPAPGRAHRSAPSTSASGPRRRSLSERGIDAVVFGPGAIEQAHAADEYVEIAELETARDHVPRGSRLMEDQRSSSASWRASAAKADIDLT